MSQGSSSGGAGGIGIVGPLVGGLMNIGQQALFNSYNSNTAAENQYLQNEFAVKSWAMQQLYNSPKAQMLRLKQAGLNPNLVYGNGADNTSSSMPASAPRDYRPQMGSPVGTDAINNYVNLQGMKRQNDLAEMEIIAKAQQVSESQFRVKKGTEVDIPKSISEMYNTNSKTAMNAFDLRAKERLYDTSVSMAEEKLRQIGLENAKLTIQNENLPDQIKADLYETYQRAYLLKSQRQTNAIDRLIKQEELKLNRNGIQKTDSLISRIFGNLLPDLDKGQGFNEYIDSWSEKVRNWWYGKHRKK